MASNMKKSKIFFAIVTLCFLVFAANCKKAETFMSAGYYSGSFTYQGQTQFDAINFDGNNFEEVPSGGALVQKFPCLSKGTYHLKKNTITFIPGNSPDCTCTECLLSGDYELIKSGTNIVFQRNLGDKVQIYNLTLIEK